MPPEPAITDAFLLGTTWRYGHDGGTPSSEAFRLLPGGGIGGYDHSNEQAWCILDGSLALFAADGRCTVRFDRVSPEGRRLVLLGRYLRDETAGIMLRLEQVLPEDSPAVERLKTIPSPAFEMTYPDLRNRDMIPPDVLRAVEPIWSRGHFPEQPIQFSLLQDVVIVKEGLVFTRDMEVVPASITQHTPAEIDGARYAVSAARAAGPLPHIAGTTLLCKKRGVGNYGHWLMEMFPKVVLALQHLPFHDLRFVIPEATGALRATMLASMQRLGIAGNRCVAQGDAPVSIGKLVMVDGLTAHGAYMSPLAVTSVEPLSWDIPAGRDRMLYLSRSSAGHRCFQDEEAVAGRARAAGYRIFDPGTVDLHEQISVFAGAQRIVGIMGAALTNIAFAPRHAQVTVLAPANMPDTFFWFIAGLRGLRYREVRCAVEGPIRGVADWDRDMVFPADLADEIFAADTSLTPPTPPPPPSPRQGSD